MQNEAHLCVGRMSWADLGLEYQNDKACATFIEFIAHEQPDILLKALERSKFFSLQADGSTDAGNEEVEMFLDLHFDPTSSDGEVCIRNRFIAVRHLSSATAQGLFDSFKRVVQYMQMDEWKTKMIGLGCDGTNANTAQGGLRGLLTDEYVVMGLCLRVRGMHFVAHKVAALERLIDRFGAYISRLIAMTEDASVKPADKEKPRAYIKKWQDSKILFGCAFFHDLLKSLATLCKVLQEDELCVV